MGYCWDGSSSTVIPASDVMCQHNKINVPFGVFGAKDILLII